MSDQEAAQVFDRWHRDSAMASHSLGFDRRPDGQYGCPHLDGPQRVVDVAAGHSEDRDGDRVWVRHSTVATVCSLCSALYGQTGERSGR